MSLAFDQVHTHELIARIILGEQKVVNTEVPRTIASLHCFKCGYAVREPAQFQMPQLGLCHTGAAESITGDGNN